MIGLDTNILVAAAIEEHPLNKKVWKRLKEALDNGNSFAITSGILAEFVHVSTDPRRFKNPLSMNQAIEWTCFWCESKEVTLLNPNEAATTRWLAWIAEFRLGRKRLLDTLIAATWCEFGVGEIFTLNPSDFTVFGEFEIHQISDSE